MKLIRIINQPEGGSPDPNGEEENILTTWALTEAQYHILLNYAVDSLLEKGFIEVADMTSEEVEELRKETEAELKKQFASAEWDVPQLHADKEQSEVKKSLFMVTGKEKDIIH